MVHQGTKQAPAATAEPAAGLTGHMTLRCRVGRLIMLGQCPGQVARVGRVVGIYIDENGAEYSVRYQDTQGTFQTGYFTDNEFSLLPEPQPIGQTGGPSAGCETGHQETPTQPGE